MTWNRKAGARTEICMQCNERPPALGKRRCNRCLAKMERDRRARIIASGDDRPCAVDGCDEPRYKTASQYSSYCKEHHLLIRREVNLKYNYGLSLQDYEQLLQRAAGACEICGSKTRLVVDHCHETGVVRGILCDDHNKMLGTAKDDVDVLRAASEYLLRQRDVLRAS